MFVHSFNKPNSLKMGSLFFSFSYSTFQIYIYYPVDLFILFLLITKRYNNNIKQIYTLPQNLL